METSQINESGISIGEKTALCFGKTQFGYLSQIVF